MDAPWRTAWITGASSGIGRALAVALAERGVKVAASARSADALADLAHAHPRIAPLPLDVTDAAAMGAAARSLAGTHGPLDLVG
jgi:NADP-dependent 3-hydroxy acid dehydrogenase YdfG